MTRSAAPLPQLNGTHFRITVVAEDGFIDFLEDFDENIKDVSGYCIDILKSISSKANFTYELHPPSGLGSLCKHSNDDTENNMSSIEPYRKKYRSQYLCGQSDVNDDRNQLGDSYATDMYLSMYYITPKRQMENKFTMPFHPPQTGALTLFGTATNIRNVEDLIQQQQTRFVFEQYRLCRVFAADFSRLADGGSHRHRLLLGLFG